MTLYEEFFEVLVETLRGRVCPIDNCICQRVVSQVTKVPEKRVVYTLLLALYIGGDHSWDNLVL